MPRTSPGRRSWRCWTLHRCTSRWRMQSRTRSRIRYHRRTIPGTSKATLLGFGSVLRWATLPGPLGSVPATFWPCGWTAVNRPNFGWITAMGYGGPTRMSSTGASRQPPSSGITPASTPISAESRPRKLPVGRSRPPRRSAGRGPLRQPDVWWPAGETVRAQCPNCSPARGMLRWILTGVTWAAPMVSLTCRMGDCCPNMKAGCIWCPDPRGLPTIPMPSIGRWMPCCRTYRMTSENICWPLWGEPCGLNPTSLFWCCADRKTGARQPSPSRYRPPWATNPTPFQRMLCVPRGVAKSDPLRNGERWWSAASPAPLRLRTGASTMDG